MMGLIGASETLYSLEGYTGDVDFIVQRMKSVRAIQPAATRNGPVDGLYLKYGIDLSTCPLSLFDSLIEENFSSEQIRILYRFLGKSGEDFVPLSSEETKYFNGVIQDYPLLSDLEFTEFAKQIIGYYWEEIKSMDPYWSMNYSSSFSQSMLMSWLIDYGFTKIKLLENYMKILKTNDRCKISEFLSKQIGKNSSPIWSQNRINDIHQLLLNRLPLTSSVGLNGTNSIDDVNLVNEKLGSLGYELINIANNDFLGLEKFNQVAGILSNSEVCLSNSDLTYIWMVSSNAPAFVDLVDSEGLKFNCTGKISSWLLDTLAASGKRLCSMQRSSLFSESGEVTNFQIIVNGVDSDGLGVELQTVGVDGNNGNFNCDDSLYSSDYTSMILTSLLFDDRIKSGQQLSLRDVNLSVKGLCTLSGHYKKDPSDANEPRLKEDFVNPSEWINAEVANDRFRLRISQDELSDYTFSDSAVISNAIQQKPIEIVEQISQSNGNDLSELIEILDNLIDESWAPSDENQHPNYYLDMLINYSDSSYFSSDGTEVNPAIPSPIPIGGKNILAIKNWLMHRPIDGYDVFGDCIVLLYNENGNLKMKQFVCSLRPGKSRVYRHIDGDQIILPGHYIFEFDSSKNCLVQKSTISIGRDSEKIGRLTDNSLTECKNLNIQIRSCDKSRVRNKGWKDILIKGNETPNSAYHEFMNCLTTTCGMSDGDEILFTMIDETLIRPPLRIAEGGE